MKAVRIVVKGKDGEMGFSSVALDDDEDLPFCMTSVDGEHHITRVDWMSQFDGPSIPVYEEVVHHTADHQ